MTASDLHKIQQDSIDRRYQEITDGRIRAMSKALEECAKQGCNEIRVFSKNYFQDIQTKKKAMEHFSGLGFTVFEEEYQWGGIQIMMVVSFKKDGEDRKLFINNK